MATGDNPLYLYTWRLPYKNRDDDPQQQSIVVYNYAHDKDSARAYVIQELEKIGLQDATIQKLKNGEIYPVHSFLTDEVDKKTTVRVYTYDKLDASERIVDLETGKRSRNTNPHKDVWRRDADPELAPDKKDREKRVASRETGLLFREYIFQDIDNPEIHYIAKTIVQEGAPEVGNRGILKRGSGHHTNPLTLPEVKYDYIEYALSIIHSKFKANKPISMEVKNHPGDLHTGVRMGYDNKPGVLEIVKVENWGYKESNLQLVSVPQSVATYKELKEKRVEERKKRLSEKRKKKRNDEIARIGEQKYYEERREKRNKNREARQLAGEVPGKTPAARRGASANDAVIKKEVGLKNEVDFGLVPSKYRV